MEKTQIKAVDSNSSTIIFNDTEDQINLIRRDLDEIMEKSTNGAKLRCKQEWYDGGEKNTKYFHSLEKYKNSKKNS